MKFRQFTTEIQEKICSSLIEFIKKNSDYKINLLIKNISPSAEQDRCVRNYILRISKARWRTSLDKKITKKMILDEPEGAKKTPSVSLQNRKKALFGCLQDKTKTLSENLHNILLESLDIALSTKILSENPEQDPKKTLQAYLQDIAIESLEIELDYFQAIRIGINENHVFYLITNLPQNDIEVVYAKRFVRHLNTLGLSPTPTDDAPNEQTLLPITAGKSSNLFSETFSSTSETETQEETQKTPRAQESTEKRDKTRLFSTKNAVTFLLEGEQPKVKPCLPKISLKPSKPTNRHDTKQSHRTTTFPSSETKGPAKPS